MATLNDGNAFLAYAEEILRIAKALSGRLEESNRQFCAAKSVKDCFEQQETAIKHSRMLKSDVLADYKRLERVHLRYLSLRQPAEQLFRELVSEHRGLYGSSDEASLEVLAWDSGNVNSAYLEQVFQTVAAANRTWMVNQRTVEHMLRRYNIRTCH